MTAQKDPMSYRDIKSVVLDRLRAGIWGPNSLLPSESDLATEFNSTRTTVNRALRELAEEGFLERKRKAGTRVLTAPTRRAQFAIPLVREEVGETGADYRYALVSRQIETAPAWLAARLSLPAGQDVVALTCMHYADNAPFQLEQRWIVPTAVPEVLDEPFDTLGPNEWLLKRVPFSNLEFSVMASKADEKLAEFLDAPLGDPIFTAERITWLEGTPITLARMYFAPGYRMTTRL